MLCANGLRIHNPHDQNNLQAYLLKRTVAAEGNSMGSMVDSAVRVLTFFVVVILILIFLNTLGGCIAAQIPTASLALRRILE